ncbi:MAG: hypothetical protein LBT59_23935 [Clostridiales bacterium]|nr:hypothetical protein [Clostridiales bacterium]
MPDSLITAPVRVALDLEITGFIGHQDRLVITFTERQVPCECYFLSQNYSKASKSGQGFRFNLKAIPLLVRLDPKGATPSARRTAPKISISAL